MESPDLIRLTASLIGIVAVLLIGAWLTRRFTGWKRPQQADSIDIISSRRLGARSSIALIEVANTRLVVGISPTQINLLHTFEPLPTQLDDKSEHNTRRFQQQLTQHLKGRSPHDS